VHNLLKSLNNFCSQHDYVLVLITDSKGSTYRKPGAMMLVSQQLEYWGLLSGGCLEGDIVLRCKDVLTNQADCSVVYNMRDEADKLWGMGLGCDGEITLLLKYLPAARGHCGFFEILNKIKVGHSFQLTLNRQDNQLGFEDLKSSSDLPLQVDGSKVASNEKPSKQFFVMLAPHRLLICGGAPDVPPVTAIAAQIGWQTHVIDHRQDFASPDLFPDANRVSLVKRSQWKDMDLSVFDSVIIMSHQFEHDQRYLKRLLETDIQYIGLLGPSKRRDKLLENCETDFEHHEGRVFGPIGLDIGAATPETIALAIIAEIQACINHKNVGFCYQDASR
jgi:xanthine dehydrogenase accessory factor